MQRKPSPVEGFRNIHKIFSIPEFQKLVDPDEEKIIILLHNVHAILP
jgi:hypothetical protein